MVAGRAREMYDAAAKERQKQSGKEHGRGKEKVPVNVPEPIKGDSRDAVGKAIGVSGKTAGAMLAKMEKQNGRPKKNGNVALQLSDLGIERMQSHRWQRIAGPPWAAAGGFLFVLWRGFFVRLHHP